MITVVAAIVEREDRRILIGQRRRDDTSPLKWEFPGGKVKPGETAEAALARELREELGADVAQAVEVGRVRHQYADKPEELEIRFFAVKLQEQGLVPKPFEQVAWVLPRELPGYDFLAANAHIVARLATGQIKPRAILAGTAHNTRAEGSATRK